MRYPDHTLQWPIAYDAVKLIAESEGCKLKAYRCPAGIPTIGWGRTQGVSLGDVITQQQADGFLLADLTDFTNGVRGLVTRPATLNELGAMVSLAYNIGLGAFRGSTVLRQHNAGNISLAAEAFKLWNKARVGGVLTVLPGLVTRRARESALYLTPDADDLTMPIAQAVDPEDSPLKHSRTIAAGTAGVGILGLDMALPWLLGDDAAHVAALLGAESEATKAAAVVLILYMLWARRDDWIKKLR